MEVNLFDEIAKDEFFIGSYPDAFAVGRWFTVEELKDATYKDIEVEYLEKFNPYDNDELELGIFDISNDSGLWDGEQEVQDTINLLKTIEEDPDVEIEVEYFDFEDDVINDLFANPMDAVYAFRFGDVDLTDEYLMFDGRGNLKSMDQDDIDDAVYDEIKVRFDEICKDNEHNWNRAAYTLEMEEPDVGMQL